MYVGGFHGYPNLDPFFTDFQITCSAGFTRTL